MDQAKQSGIYFS